MKALEKLYTSKTFWAGAVLMIAGIVEVATGGEITPTAVIELVGGFGFISLRDAIRKI